MTFKMGYNINLQNKMFSPRFILQSYILLFYTYLSDWVSYIHDASQVELTLLPQTVFLALQKWK